MKRRILGIFLMLFASTSILLAAPQVVRAADTPVAADDSAQCDAGDALNGAFTWMICGAIRVIVGVVDYIRDQIIVPFLVEKPLDKSDPDVAKVYDIWAQFRNVASVFFILVFFLVIFGTAIGWDNYTIKKIMPRLVLGAVLVPFSWWICVIVIDVGNVLGQGLLAITSSVIPPANIDFTSSISKIFLGAGAAVALAGAVTALWTLSLGVLFSMLIAMAAVFLTLVLRKIMIVLLVTLSPFAFLAWILPNTSKWFKEWWTNFFKLVMMYPIIMMLFEAGRLFAATAGATSGKGQAAAALFQIVGLTMPLFAVPMAFSWAGKGMKVGGAAIGKAAGAVDKRVGKDSAMAKERAAARVANNARRATSYNKLESSGNRGVRALGKTVGSVSRASALKRSGLGGLTSSIPGYGKLPILSKPMNAAARQKLNQTASKAENDEAQSNATSRMRKETKQSSAERIANQAAAAYDKLEEAKVIEAGRAVKTKDEAHGGKHHSNNIALQDIDLSKDGVEDIKAIITEAQGRGDKATMIAGLRRLGQSSGGVNGAQELAVGRIGEYVKDGKKHYIGGNGFNGTNENGEVTFDANGNAETHGKALLGGGWGQNVAGENQDLWKKGMKDAKGFDVNKPIAAGATDFSASDLAKEHHTAVRRRLAHIDQASRSDDEGVAGNGIKAAKDFSEAAAGIAGSSILQGQVASATKARIAEGGDVIVPTQPGETRPYAEVPTAYAPVVQAPVAQTFANMVAPAPPASAVTPRVSAAIVDGVGDRDVSLISDVAQTIRNEINTSSNNTSQTQANIENHILEHGSIDRAGLAQAGVTSLYGPQRPVEHPIPAELSAHITDQFKDNLDAIHDIERHYTRPENEQYRSDVNRAFLQGGAIPIPAPAPAAPPPAPPSPGGTP